MGSVYKHRRGETESRTYYYTVKVEGRWREFAGKTDKGATQTLMHDHQRRVDRGEVGLVDPFAEGKKKSLVDLVATYIARPDAAGQNPRHLVGERERLLLAFAEMHVTSFVEIVGTTGNETMPKIELFLNKLRLGEVRAGRPTHRGGKPKARSPASVATIRGYAISLRAFGRYLVERGTWPRNPFETLKPVKILKSDRVRENRALMPEEIDLLVQAAEVRPVQQWRATHPNASEQHLEALRRSGVIRGRIYLTLSYTGLRFGELAQLTWGELTLVEGQEVAEIVARKQKNRDDAIVVLHPMLGEMLRRHRQECSEASIRAGKGPTRNSDRVFRVSSSLLRWLKLDAEWAGIGLFDARGRSTTIHGIRSGFATTLRRNSTDPALRMRLMRHKTAELTMGTYDKVETDELRRELERLPVANALRMAAGAESVSVPVPVQPRPIGADGGRCRPEGAPSAAGPESANGGQTRGSWPVVAAAGRSGPEADGFGESVGPAGLEPATKRV